MGYGLDRALGINGYTLGAGLGLLGCLGLGCMGYDDRLGRNNASCRKVIQIHKQNGRQNSSPQYTVTEINLVRNCTLMSQ